MTRHESRLRYKSLSFLFFFNNVLCFNEKFLLFHLTSLLCNYEKNGVNIIILAIKKSQLEFPSPSNTKLCKLLIHNLNLLKIERLLS